MKLRQIFVCMSLTTVLPILISSSAVAKDGFQLTKEAEKLQAKEEVKEVEAAKEQGKAIEEAERGHRGAANRTAEEAGKDQAEARELEKEADKTERKAVRKGY